MKTQILVPILAEKYLPETMPQREGRYETIHRNGTQRSLYWNGIAFEAQPWEKDITHWLRPISQEDYLREHLSAILELAAERAKLTERIPELPDVAKIDKSSITSVLTEYLTSLTTKEVKP